MEGFYNLMRAIRIFVMTVLMIVLVKEMYVINAQSPYACWGGCYNECIVLNYQAGALGRSTPCYVQCLGKCIPTSAADYQNYCKLGCSLELCAPARAEAGAELDQCFGSCGNACGV